MATSALFVELVVIGLGALLNVVLIIAAVFNVPLADIEANAVNGAGTVAAVLALSYVLGVIVDRAADALTRPIAAKLRRKSFSSQDDFTAARIEAYRAAELKSMYEYSRHRMRIARGWTLNATTGLGAWHIFLCSEQASWLRAQQQAVLVADALIVALAVGAGYTWAHLTMTEAENLAQ